MPIENIAPVSGILGVGLQRFALMLALLELVFAPLSQAVDARRSKGLLSGVNHVARSGSSRLSRIVPTRGL